ncbi:CD276 antigen-like protein [Lates japonicus]|uniref:CD276 antigen-like protein n=1 Tax=Lates japonicus TaxID=270547 RepID=A0AAD3MID2_LATJO|nr:CD276 antigen-like protein [Lates japonicus]
MAVDRFSVFLLILKSLWTLIRGADVEVSCVLTESCILPCSFQSGDETIIHWVQVAGNVPVHSYYYNQDQLGHQDQRFRGRTSLFKDQISEEAPHSSCGGGSGMEADTDATPAPGEETRSHSSTREWTV